MPKIELKENVADQAIELWIADEFQSSWSIQYWHHPQHKNPILNRMFQRVHEHGQDTKAFEFRKLIGARS